MPSKESFGVFVKRVLIPIEKHEIALFLSMAFLMLCMLFNFASLRALKDGLVVSSIGAEAISFLKLWLVLPSSIIFTICYAKLSNLFTFEKVFYIVVSVFLVIFIFFAYILYPNQELYHPDANAINQFCVNYPNFKWFAQIVGKWSYALMYIFADLWSVVVINLLFWQFANNIFNTEQAKRFYPILGMLGNFGLVIAGNTLIKFSDTNAEFLDITLSEVYQKQSKDLLQPLVLSISFAGTFAMFMFYLINNIILKSGKIKDEFKSYANSNRTNLSLKESIRLVLRSSYIGRIVILVLCYGLLINILEGPWKAQLRAYCPSTVEYVNFMGKFNIYLGFSSIIFTFIASNILRKLSWRAAALFTPSVIFVTGMLFFMFMLSNEINFLGMQIDPIFMAVMIGAVQNILSKSTKYSLFDSTKEMAYIPLSLELRTKGKATVEIIGLKFGKSLGAFAQSSIFILFPSLDFHSIAMQLSVIFILFIVLWFYNIIELNKEYVALLSHDK